MRILKCSSGCQQQQDITLGSRWGLKRANRNAVKALGNDGYALVRKEGSTMRQTLRACFSRSKKKNEQGRELERRVLRPISPDASTVQLSRTNSNTTREVTDDDLSLMCGSRRVSFEAQVRKVIINQMNERELRDAFYTRGELSIFREAYRIHRNTPDWKRENDGLPCDCDACQDRVDWEAKCRMVLESPPVSPPRAPPVVVTDSEEERSPGGADDVPQLKEYMDSETETDDASLDEPPSPVISLRGGDQDRGGTDADYHNYMASPTGVSGRVSGSPNDCVLPNVQHAVAQFGERYAYTTLRMQGFSDRYIRTYFMPQGCPEDP